MEIVTGTSSGLGLGLAEHFLARVEAVAGLSRRDSELTKSYANYFHMQCDLGDLKNLPARLRQFYQMLRDEHPADTSKPLRVWLNAGMLGRIDDLQNTSMDELRQITDVNLWANKIIIDSLASPDCPFQAKSVVAISSGASVNGHRGWAGYSISKSALNMLIKLYSEELPNMHLISLAPGLIESGMQETISGIEDTDTFTALKRLQEARGTDAMPEPREAARRIMEKWPQIAASPSGSFLDIRKI